VAIKVRLSGEGNVSWFVHTPLPWNIPGVSTAYVRRVYGVRTACLRRMHGVSTAYARRTDVRQ